MPNSEFAYTRHRFLSASELRQPTEGASSDRTLLGLPSRSRSRNQLGHHRICKRSPDGDSELLNNCWPVRLTVVRAWPALQFRTIQFCLNDPPAWLWQGQREDACHSQPGGRLMSDVGRREFNALEAGPTRGSKKSAMVHIVI
jgi:hypothetical protein